MRIAAESESSNGWLCITMPNSGERLTQIASSRDAGACLAALPVHFGRSFVWMAATTSTRESPLRSTHGSSTLHRRSDILPGVISWASFTAF